MLVFLPKVLAQSSPILVASLMAWALAYPLLTQKVPPAPDVALASLGRAYARRKFISKTTLHA
ncbi:hypothetical protein ArV2_gp32 [Arthrobacter phage vB_ArS-ArV2]|uniref:Uncharacterized protein n=1 Tax=Arthrobacter phage vB_ArS-ArV2 TaxID=1414742 RepID=V5R905_9CAUD|nr:hypothetical protein ArV2_gp32 [Arthrobacter phage vB_ArS-ArV2]AHB31643.1 hypothetical protein ArV2_gp32 [Arthrobacter phage vB_ArS-ArV2]